MRYLATYKKSPTAVLDYSIDWRSWLLAGETIQSSTWIITSLATPQTGDVTEEQDVIVSGVTTIWIQGGLSGTQYTLADTIVTSGGRTDTRTLLIDVEPR